MQQGGVPGARLATASSSFTVEKGVPVILEVPPSEETAVEDLLLQILSTLNTEAASINNLDSAVEALDTNVGLNTSRIVALSEEVDGLGADVDGLGADVSAFRVSVNALNDWAFGANGTPTAPSLGSAAFNIEALDASVSSLQNNVRNLNNTVIPAINARIDLQEQALKQSGLQYSQDITQEYQTRETANGENVFNGSTAILKSVVGNTIATSNQLNLIGVANSYFSVNDNGKEIEFLANASYVVAEIGIMQDLCPYLHIGDTIYLYETSGNMPNGLVDSSNATVIPLNTATVVTSAMLSTTLHLGINPLQAGAVLSNLQITKVQNASWTPYFEGLKSAEFAGIESKNAEETETSTLDFPNTVNPLGQTIYFENKKIVDYGITVALDGTEDWLYYTANLWASVAPSAIIVGFLPASASNLQANAASTDGYLEVKFNGTLPKGNFVIGNGSQNLWWFGCFNYLGLDASWSDKDNPTAEEQTTAISNLKAYLAQRYAEGNPVTIRYVTPTGQTETPFNSAQEEAGNSYTAYLGGVETVNGNSDAEYGAENTLTQNYVLIKEV
jgi:hypothetical protein